MMSMFHYLKSLLSYVVRRYREDHCTRRAAALTYMSLFAVVPFMTVMYVMLSTVPAFQAVGQQIQEIIFTNVLPASSGQIEIYLDQFSQQARRLTGAGIGVLFITAILMLRSIEQTFNSIWRVRENRRGMASFLLYWAILSLGPLFIGLAFAISTYVVSVSMVFDRDNEIGYIQEILQLVPYLLSGAVFTLIYTAVPNCKVSLKHSLIGGFTTALIFKIAAWMFAELAAIASFTLIYGTFAIIPLFLLWIYISWQIILAGAELTHALDGFTSRNTQMLSNMTIALGVLELLWRHHQKSDVVKEKCLLNTAWLFDKYSLYPEQWDKLRTTLFNARLMRATVAGELILGRDLNGFSLWQLYRLLDSVTTDATNESATKSTVATDLPIWFQHSQHLLEQQQNQAEKMLAVPLAQLFSDTEITGDANVSDLHIREGNAGVGSAEIVEHRNA
jgi:membrane protein